MFMILPSEHDAWLYAASPRAQVHGSSLVEAIAVLGTEEASAARCSALEADLARLIYVLEYWYVPYDAFPDGLFARWFASDASDRGCAAVRIRQLSPYLAFARANCAAVLEKACALDDPRMLRFLRRVLNLPASVLMVRAVTYNAARCVHCLLAYLGLAEKESLAAAAAAGAAVDRAMLEAIARGHADCMAPLLQRLDANDCRWCTAASRCGRLETLRWLRDRDCAWNALTSRAAAEKGYVHILDWQRARGCPWDASLSQVAAARGHTRVLEWIVTMGSWRFDAQTFRCATPLARRWLEDHEQRQEKQFVLELELNEFELNWN